MFSLRRTSLLLAAALCVLAGDLTAQRTQTLSSRAARMLQDSGVTVRVSRAGVDTMASRVQRVRPGEMIVNVTGARPSRIRPSIRIPTRPPIVQGTDATPDPTPDAGPGKGSTDTGERPSDDGTRPDRERPSDDGARPDRERPSGGDTRPDRERPKGEERPAEEAKGRNEARGEDPGATGATEDAGDDRIAYELSNYEIGVADAAGERFHLLTPIVEIEGGGLRYDSKDNVYKGSILIGLLDNQNPAATGDLGQQVVVQITGDVQRVEAVPLRSMNLPFHRVDLVVARPRGDSVLIRLRPTFDPRGGSVISIPIIHATLTLQASPRRIAGFGLEVAELIVMNQDNGDSIPVALTSLMAKPTPSQVRATREGAISKIRSSGVGVDTVRLAGGAYQGFAVIQYAWPIAFILAALIGGLFGGVLNALSTKRHSDPRTVAFLGMQGALTGIVGAVLYAVGINVIGWAPSAEYGEALMFAVAFGTGLMGPRIFDKVLPKLSVGRKDGDDAPPSTPPASPPAEPSAPEPAAVG